MWNYIISKYTSTTITYNFSICSNIFSTSINIWIQIILFAVVSIVLLFATRPLARKFFNSRLVRTNADTLIGEKIRITERVSNADQTGVALANGQEWTVRANNDEDIFEVGEPAQVTRIEGVKLIVDKIKEDS